MTRRPAVVSSLALLAAVAAGQALAQEPVVEFTVSPRDTLIGLSQDVFTSPAAWREIAVLNKLPNPNRILPGQVLKVPVRLMRWQAIPARITSTVGEVQLGGAPTQAGAAVQEGQALQTGENASAVIELADGSRVRIPPSSLAELAASRRYGGRVGAEPAADGASSWFAGAMRLLRGSVEAFARKVPRAKPLEVETPTAVVGVRGTQFRVAIDADPGKAALTRTEVLEGLVRLDSAAQNARAAGTDVAAGFGATVEATAPPGAPRPLPQAPDLAAMPERFERPLVRFALPGELGTVRVQVALDAAFDKIVHDQRIPAGTDVRIPGLDDGSWQLRARRVDDAGLEGFDSARAFVLKARPEPPATNTPRAGAKQTVGGVEFSWASNIEAQTVHLQVASDAKFEQLVLDRRDVSGSAVAGQLAQAGTYHWRVASIKADGDHGPFGDAQRFELRALPEPPTGGVAPDGRSLVLSWSGRAEDIQHVELASDPAFKTIVAQADLDKPEWAVPPPSRSGTYYFRYRSIEPDGFVSPYSSTLTIEVPRDWKPLWLLAPLLLLL